MTRDEVARAVEVSPNTIFRLEADDQRLDRRTVAAVAELLRVPFDWMSGEVAPPSDLDPAAIEHVAATKRGPSFDSVAGKVARTTISLPAELFARVQGEGTRNSMGPARMMAVLIEEALEHRERKNAETSLTTPKSSTGPTPKPKG